MIDVKHAYVITQERGKLNGTQINDGEEGGKNVIIAMCRDGKRNGWRAARRGQVQVGISERCSGFPHVGTRERYINEPKEISPLHPNVGDE